MNENPKRNAGGLAIYIFTNLKYIIEETYTLHGTESLWLNVYTIHLKENSSVGVIYWHPSENVDNFIEYFSVHLQKLTAKEKSYYILGDININIDKIDTPTHAINFINLIKNHSTNI